jgi:hypothetical protein
MQIACYSCQIPIKRAFSSQIFERYSNIKFHENPSSGSRVVLCGRTEKQTAERTGRQAGRQAGGQAGGQAGRQAGRHDSANSRFSQFCEGA